MQYNAVFKNTSLAGQTWLWDFGDGQTSTAFEPIHLYAAAGTYNVVLIAFNPNTCNLSDTTAAFTITVFDSPTPDFSFAPVPHRKIHPLHLLTFHLLMRYVLNGILGMVIHY